MTGLGIIEVAIGLIFVYSLLSIIATTLNTIIAYLFKTRARHLKQGLDAILSDPEVKDLFLHHPLINMVEQRTRVRAHWQEVIIRFLTNVIRFNWRHPLAQAQERAQETASLNRVEWIDPKIFSKVMTDILAEKAALTLFAPLYGVIDSVLEGAERDRLSHMVDLLPGGSLTFEEFQREIYKLGDPSDRDELQKVYNQIDARRKALNLNNQDGSRVMPLLEGLRYVNEDSFRKAVKVLVTSARTLDEAQQQLETWFDQRMDQLTELYKRRITLFSLGIGIFLALVLNADSLQIARSLFDDPSLRAAVVAAANQVVDSGELQQLVPTATPTLEPTLEPTPEATVEASAEAGLSAQGVEPTLEPTPTPEPAAETNPLVETTVAIAQVEQLLNRLLALNLPISWENTPLTVDCFTSDGDSRLLCDNTRNLWLLNPSNNPDWLGFILRKLIGIAITSLAIAQGAPFWFDLLNRLVRGRSSSSSS
ncbi:MAG: hypothetical protein IPK17_32230 [Chloroflexi bacterium]|uniref:hypothetical protein n=1 Tax=Candidatus Flexifilum breve TaxID=3140694 RepID=UPI0031348155|nr:hypothetical protein [Chloroflexota bacterium]